MFGFGYTGIIASMKKLPSGGGSLLLDTYTGAKVAFSVRKLRNAYSGACLRVRRSSDNAELDINFLAGNLDTSALTTFVGANDGFVTTWYDQSGNSNDATQSTGSLQHYIIVAGVLQTSGAYPVLYKTNDTRRYYLTNNFNLPNEFTFINAYNRFQISEFSFLSGSNDYNYPFIHYVDHGRYIANSTTFFPFGTNSVLNAKIASTYRKSSTASGGFLNGVSFGAEQNIPITSTSLINQVIARGANLTSSKTHEVILWDTDRNTDLTAITLDLNTYYGTY